MTFTAPGFLDGFIGGIAIGAILSLGVIGAYWLLSNRRSRERFRRERDQKVR